MRASPLLNQRIMEHLNTGVLLLDAELIIIHMNPSAEALLEVSGKRGVGTHFFELAVEDQSDVDAMRDAVITGHSYTKREAHIHLQNQQTLTLDYSVSPVTHPETRTPTLLVELQGRDRLMRISREEQLIAKQETTRSLVRGLAHEIKNPLGGIRGAAQLLERELPSAELKEYTNIIIEEADRLRDLVDRLLGPRNMLNIGRNAMQAMLENPDQQERPSLTIRTRSVRQFTIGHHRHRLVAQVEIIDNGPGIPEGIRDNLFYPMVSGRAEGSGLGLSISQSIINQINGIIEFTSVPHRTVFSIFLPLESL